MKPKWPEAASIFSGARRRHQDEPGIGRLVLELAGGLEPVHAGKMQIDERNVISRISNQLQGMYPRIRVVQMQVETGLTQQFVHQGADGLGAFNQKHAHFRAHAAR